MILLPSVDDIDEFLCPCCTRWTDGFPGLAIRNGVRRHYIISPSEPNEFAIYNGAPDL
jgi:hypothetical protein